MDFSIRHSLLQTKSVLKLKEKKIKEIQSGKTYICCRYKDLGCDIAYEITPKTHHKVIRKLNAHESQRCPCNKNRTRKARGKTRALRNCSAIHIAKALAAKPPAARVELRKKRKLKKASKAKRPKVVAADSRASSGTTLVVEDRAERAAAQSAPARPQTGVVDEAVFDASDLSGLVMSPIYRSQVLSPISQFESESRCVSCWAALSFEEQLEPLCLLCKTEEL